jgi:hypothetical protein
MKVKPANCGASVKASGGKKMSKAKMANGGMMKVMGDKDKPAMAKGGMPKKYSRKK